METFAEWKERVRVAGLYKVGFSVALAFIALMLFILRDPVDPDLGIGFIAWALALVSTFLWFLGFWDVARCKGLSGASMFLSLLYLPGFAILMTMRETWEAFGPDEKVLPSATPQRAQDLPKVRRLNW